MKFILIPATATPVELRCVAFRSSAVHGLNFSEQLLTGKLNTSVKINHTISPIQTNACFYACRALTLPIFLRGQPHYNL